MALLGVLRSYCMSLISFISMQKYQNRINLCHTFIYILSTWAAPSYCFYWNIICKINLKIKPFFWSKKKSKRDLTMQKWLKLDNSSCNLMRFVMATEFYSTNCVFSIPSPRFNWNHKYHHKWLQILYIKHLTAHNSRQYQNLYSEVRTKTKVA